MTAPTMRRLPRLVLAFAGLLLVLPLPWPAAPASAQDDATGVRLTLLSQTPWNSAYDESHTRELRVRFRAENLTDQDIDRLSIGVTLYGRVLSRTAFEQSLATDPTLVLKAETLPREGPLPAGSARDFDVVFALDSPGISSTGSGVYPLRVELRSGFTVLGAIRTPVIFLVREPEFPLALSWTLVLDTPISFAPSGTFTSTALEEALQQDGVIASQIRAIADLADPDGRGRAVDVALSPMLVSQLEQMADGYTIVRGADEVEVPADAEPALAAADALEQLRTIAAARNVRFSPLPLSMAEIPSLLEGGLARDVPLQLQAGADAVAEALGVPVPRSVLRPPGAALDESALRTLSALGVQTLVVGPSTVTPAAEDPLGFAGPPTAALDGGALDAIVPDPNVMTLLDSELVRADPVLGAQAVLAETATIWQEQPGVVRGLGLVVSEDAGLPPAFYPALARGVGGAPWLDPMHAEGFVEAFPPAEAVPLAAPLPRAFPDGYVSQLRQARRRVETLRSMLVEPSDEPDTYDTMLLVAESRQFLSDPASGLGFITSVRDSVNAVFQSVTAETPEAITLTSSTGSSIPVTVRNESEERLRVGVSLVSPHLRDAPAKQVELPAGGSELVTFPIDVRSTGRFTVGILVEAPSGRVLQQSEVIVRSTVYNRIALIITIGAGVVLLALWGRRLVSRMHAR